MGPRSRRYHDCEQLFTMHKRLSYLLVLPFHLKMKFVYSAVWRIERLERNKKIANEDLPVGPDFEVARRVWWYLSGGRQIMLLHKLISAWFVKRAQSSMFDVMRT